MFERNDNTERFYADTGPADDRAVALGFSWALRYASEHGHREVLLVMPGLQNVQHLGRVIGKDAAATLRRRRKLVQGGITITLATASRLPYGFDGGPILAIWTRDKELDKLDTLGAPALCAVPWQPENIAGWKANWSPVDLQSGVAAEGAADSLNPVVVQALRSLTAIVNVGTGLSHPSDRSSAVQMFRLLRDGGEAYDPDAVRAWAVQHGWDPVDARELADVAQKILDRRALRTEGRMWREDALSRWREEARNSA